MSKAFLNDNIQFFRRPDRRETLSHYQGFKIQPSKFVIENKMLLFPEGCAIKYICRHPHKVSKRKKHLLKAIHFIEMIIERDYDADTSI